MNTPPAGSLEAVFESSDVERFGWIFDGGLGGEAIARRVGRSSLETVFESSDVERFAWILDGGLGGEAKETALVLPVMRLDARGRAARVLPQVESLQQEGELQ